MKGEEKKEWQELYTKIIRTTLFIKAAPSRAEVANGSQEANVAANVTSPDVASISEGGTTTTCEKEGDVSNIENIPRGHNHFCVWA